MADVRPSSTPVPSPAAPKVAASKVAPASGKGFAELGVPAALVEILAAQGITAPFPIQTATLPDSLAGRDVLGRGRTGSGKTYAFVLPLLARLSANPKPKQAKQPRALILAPTRELASQIEASIAPLAKPLGLRTLTVFGGVGANPQISGLRSGIDVLVACPGRLEDLISSGHADLSQIEITILDEADHMADLGFLPAVRRLLDRTPKVGQRMLFSATLDAGVDVIVKRFLTNPITHSVDSAESPVAKMTHHVLQVAPDDRVPILVELTSAPGRTLVFTRTKHGAKKLTKQLIAAGVPAVELHGNLSQNARTRNLEAFSGGETQTLVATDIAARGIHVDDIGLVVHADPPVEHKAYLHRSGRTARAGNGGTVITLMTDDQVSDVRALTKRAAINPITTRLKPGHPLLAELAPGERSFVTPSAVPAAVEPSRGGGRSGGSGRSGSSGRSGTSGRSGAGSSGGARGGSGRGAAAGSSGGRGAGSSGGRGAGSGSSGGRRGGSSGKAAADGSGSGSGQKLMYSSTTPGAAPAPRISGAAAFSAGARPRGGR